MSQEIAQLRKMLKRLQADNARLLEREKKSVELIKELIANALLATFNAAEAASLLKSASQSMSMASAQACLLSWQYQNDENLAEATSPAVMTTPTAGLTLVKSLELREVLPAKQDSILLHRPN